MPFRYTSPMQKRLTRRLAHMLNVAVRHFPELEGKTITVGYTAAHLGVAVRDDLLIRLRARKVSYNTIGHELTHLIQGMNGVPEGEKQCDIWTLARHLIFCDEPPTYLNIPQLVRGNWQAYALQVHGLCRRAIVLRKTYRNYIQWLEKEMQALESQTPVSGNKQGKLDL